MKLTLPVSRVSLCLLFSLGSLIISADQAFSQSLGINSTGAEADPSAALDVSFTNKGLLIPRVALTAVNSAAPIAAPATSLLVYNTATAGTAPHQVEPGYYYWNGNQWIRLANANTGPATAWSLNGNAGTDPVTNFIGTTDSKPLIFKVNGEKAGLIPATVDGSLFLGYQAGKANSSGATNIAVGNQALFNNTTGTNNIAIGVGALFANVNRSNLVAIGNGALFNNGAEGNGSGAYNNVAIGYHSLYSNYSGYDNTAIGTSALRSNTTGISNSALGTHSLSENTTGQLNAALGAYALSKNTTGNSNSAIGAYTLVNNTIGNGNTAVGGFALTWNTSGYQNSAVGDLALGNNTSGSQNSALGSNALLFNTWGSSNSAVGYQSLYKNATGNNNSALGAYALFSNSIGGSNSGMGNYALYNNTEGGSNSAFGASALYSNTNGNYNTAIGVSALQYTTSGGSNTAMGFHALIANGTGSFNTAVGNSSGTSTHDLVNTGAFGYLARPTANNQYHIGNSNVTNIGGQVNWSAYSDQRFKVDVQENVKGLDFILKLRPVTYHWDIDSLNRFIYGKVAADTLFAHASAREGIAHQEKISYTGFLAQEVEAAAQSVGYDFSGVSAPANARTPYSIRYAEFVVPLVKAVQEQQGQLGQQSQVLAGLSSRLDRPVVRLASAEEWADRVFEPGYRLRPLSEVERFMTHHKHLPGVPSAHELAEKGVDVSAMLSKHMEKIEELTLYVVELEKKNNELARKNEKLEQLEAIVAELQKEMKARREVK